MVATAVPLHLEEIAFDEDYLAEGGGGLLADRAGELENECLLFHGGLPWVSTTLVTQRFFIFPSTILWTQAEKTQFDTTLILRKMV